jgi:hypothetical protein
MQMVALHLDAKFVVLVCVELMATDVLTDRKAQPKGDVKVDMERIPSLFPVTNTYV